LRRWRHNLDHNDRVGNHDRIVIERPVASDHCIGLNDRVGIHTDRHAIAEGLARKMSGLDCVTEPQGKTQFCTGVRHALRGHGDHFAGKELVTLAFGLFHRPGDEFIRCHACLCGRAHHVSTSIVLANITVRLGVPARWRKRVRTSCG
jgi:hypothetical protein